MLRDTAKKRAGGNIRREWKLDVQTRKTVIVSIMCNNEN